MNGNVLKFRRSVDKHGVVGLDTAPLIYLIEDVAPYADLLHPLFERLESHALAAVTSTITLAEILTKPLVDKNFSLVDEIKFTINAFSALSMVAVDEKLAEAAAMIRARHAVRLPDAMQIAAAIQGEATIFLTNDKRLKKVVGIEVLLLSDYV